MRATNYSRSCSSSGLKLGILQNCVQCAFAKIFAVKWNDCNLFRFRVIVIIMAPFDSINLNPAFSRALESF